jgi:hypothetical protein
MENIFDKMVSTFEKGDNQFDINPTFEKDDKKGLYYFELKEFRIYGWESIESYIASDPQQTPFMRLIPNENKEFYKGYKTSISMSLYERGEMSLGIFETRILYPLFYNLVSYDIDFAETLLSFVDLLYLNKRIITLKQLFKMVIINENLPDIITLQFESDAVRTRYKDTLRYFKYGIQYRIKLAMEQNNLSYSDISVLKAKDFPIFDLTPDQEKEYETRKALLEMPINSTPSKIRLSNEAIKADLHRVIIALHELNFFTDEHGGKISLTKVEKAFNDLLGCNFSDGDRANIRNAKEKATNEEIFDNLKGALNQYITRKNSDNKNNKKN